MQFDQLKRRQFITLLGGAAAWPLAARAAASNTNLPGRHRVGQYADRFCVAVTDGAADEMIHQSDRDVIHQQRGNGLVHAAHERFANQKLDSQE